ncbi:putative MSHA biogenesis protein, MshJ [Magnetofaba australis IT-1]|uniref:Putative MSHA biogenesis protein, MshJ n=2 Tax=Magnetofaba TaxID=1472292 RepID=A0A1Y2K164_9PROT|nr:putative MSHA biogenesis protein, MshJ [Magnetofaba australis IT-1]
MMLGAGVAVLLFGANAAALEPMERAKEAFETRRLAAQEKINLQRAVASGIRSRAKLDPDLANRKRLEQMQAEIVRIDKRMAALEATPVTPRLMREALQKLINRMDNLQLIHLEALPSETIFFTPPPKPEAQLANGKPAAKPGKTATATSANPTPQSAQQALTGALNPDGTPKSLGGLLTATMQATGMAMGADGAAQAQEQQKASGVFRHGVKIEFQGSYADTREFLRRIEALPWTLFWDELDYKVDQFPGARIVMVVYAISREQEFLGA